MDLAPWQLTVPVILFGAGLGVGSSSLLLVTIAGVDVAESGAASGVLNTVTQLGLAAGPATVGTVFFSRLAADGDFVGATLTSLVVGLVLFAAALLACLLLPRPVPAAVDPNVPAASR